MPVTLTTLLLFTISLGLHAQTISEAQLATQRRACQGLLLGPKASDYQSELFNVYPPGRRARVVLVALDSRGVRQHSEVPMTPLMKVALGIDPKKNFRPADVRIEIRRMDDGLLRIETVRGNRTVGTVTLDGAQSQIGYREVTELADPAEVVGDTAVQLLNH